MTLLWLRLGLLLALLGVSSLALAGHEVTTNQIEMADAPSWVTRVRVDKIVDHIQMLLEWDIRKIQVSWYSDQDAFERVHNHGPLVLAFSRKSDNSVHMGPKVTDANFNATFTHELVHIISYQKYKDAIPGWLEEGLANHLGKTGKVDYAWLNKQPFPKDVHELTHPFSGSVDHVHYSYIASQALIEMIAAKCDLANLLRLSVGRKMEDYLNTYCELPDLNAAFKKWVNSHAGAT